MTWLVPRPMAIGDSNVSHTSRVLGRVDHITVFEIFLTGPGTSFGVASHPGSRLFPPAPLTGDVGRDRGDAGRALLFLRANRPTSEHLDLLDVCALAHSRRPPGPGGSTRRQPTPPKPWTRSSA